MGMWALFSASFRKKLTAVFGYDVNTAKSVTKDAKAKYKEIIADLPEFEKNDRFKMNIVNCAMLGAFILSMPKRPNVERLTVYYADAMMTKPMKWFCRKNGRKKFTEKDIVGMKATAELKAADRNGICVLMQKLGLYDLTPALCHLDYTMSEAGGVADFVREHTIASGGPYCDCGYKRKNDNTI